MPFGAAVRGRRAESLGQKLKAQQQGRQLPQRLSATAFFRCFFEEARRGPRRASVRLCSTQRRVGLLYFLPGGRRGRAVENSSLLRRRWRRGPLPHLLPNSFLD